MHLKRDEVHEVFDMLQAHSFHHTIDERARTRDAIFAFCIDRKNDIARVWDAYTIIQHMYDETDVEMRTRLMNEFFERKRCDMAFHVFGHMRQQSRQDKRPTVDTYVQCFEGIGKCADMENLEMVHNMMKMDPYIEPSTRLYNALMLAYAICEDPYKALEFWADITNSREGPTYSSLQIVFRVCEMKPFGDKLAKEIWNKMRRMEIEVTPAVFSAYVGALAGQALLDEVKALIDGMESDLGFGPDIIT
jgi:ubiquitin-like modifier-activating enzyme ATG7